MPIGEFALIDRYFRAAGVPRADVVLGVGDDGAILRPPAGFDLVAVSDTLVEGVHFPLGSSPASIGHRALAVNLSDIAAMGAVPAWSLLALTLPAAEERWLDGFAKGFAALARAHDVALVGGDTTRGPLMVNVQVMGFVPTGCGLRRSGASPGDLLCVSGTPGDAATGLRGLQGRASDHTAQSIRDAWQSLQRRFEFPTPRLELGRRLATIASACIDVSDGLAGDVDKMLAASGCGATIDLDALPRSAAMSVLVAERVLSESEVLELALAGGDDYELAFAVPTARRTLLDEIVASGEAHVIGEITPPPTSHQSARIRFNSTRGAAVTELAARAVGFDHFGG